MTAEPNSAEVTTIAISGRDVTSLLGNTTLTEALLLAVDGTQPDPARVKVVDAVLVALLDHGITPSSLTTRLVLDGAPESFSGAVAAGLLAVGSRFLGTIEDAGRLLQSTVAGAAENTLAEAANAEVARLLAAGERIPGLGHNLHDGDPRVAPLLQIAETAGLSGRHAEAFALLPDVLERRTGKRLAPNAAGAIGAVLSDLGYRPNEMRGFALVARCAGLFAHIVDERERPIARDVWQSLNRAESGG